MSFHLYDYEAYKLDYKLTDSYLLTINITCGILTTSFHINNPNKYGFEIWQHLRNSKTGESRYDGARIEKKGYNMTILFNDNYVNGTYHYIKSIDGILEMGIKHNHGNAKMYFSTIKIPIEYCYDILDKIIIDLKK